MNGPASGLQCLEAFSGKKLDAFNEYQRAILADGKIDDQRTDNSPAYLKLESRKTVLRLANLKWIWFQSADDLAKG